MSQPTDESNVGTPIYDQLAADFAAGLAGPLQNSSDDPLIMRQHDTGAHHAEGPDSAHD